MRGHFTSVLADRVNTDKDKIVKQSCEIASQVKADDCKWQIIQVSHYNQKYNR